MMRPCPCYRPQPRSSQLRVFSLAAAAALAVGALTAVGIGADSGAADAGRAPQANAPAVVVQHFDKIAEEKFPWGSLRWLMSSKLEPQAGITLGIAEIKPEQSNPPHVHDNCEEVLYMLSGSCEHRVGTQTVTLKAGDTLRIPAGVPHAARTGREPMRAIVVYNTGARQFRPVGN